MLRVIRNHRSAASYNARPAEFEGADEFKPMGIDQEHCPRISCSAPCANDTWDEALDLGEKHGFRNAQVTVLAPTGTIGLIMDCDTTGIEPDFALVKFKKLSGGGYFKIINQLRARRPFATWATPRSRSRTSSPTPSATRPSSTARRSSTTRPSLAKGFGQAQIDAVEAGLESAFETQLRLQQVHPRRGVPAARSCTSPTRR